ncbi:MAG: hypothetical protein IMZ60_02515 [Actinobacteria bacterium]|nr:hypothetical protein [Actinomycetota bacterium]
MEDENDYNKKLEDFEKFKLISFSILIIVMFIIILKNYSLFNLIKEITENGCRAGVINVCN